MKKSFKIQWDKFRKEVMEIDNHSCVRCYRCKLDGAVLQVHHKKYISGKLPWDYPYSDCETLCMGCHAELHGIIPPKSGWTFHYDEDFGELSEFCDYCHTEIRYVFYISHPTWEPLGVGTNCCDKLTSSNKATEILKKLSSYQRRLDGFVNSPRWFCGKDFYSIKQKEYFIKIILADKEYQIIVNSKPGKNKYHSLIEAKTIIFQLIDDGTLEKYFNKIIRA